MMGIWGLRDDGDLGAFIKEESEVSLNNSNECAIVSEATNKSTLLTSTWR